MEDFEKMERVEKLRQKTGVTYEEAKNALEACNWDIVYRDKHLFMKILSSWHRKFRR